jgi:hypothetical protein
MVWIAIYEAVVKIMKFDNKNLFGDSFKERWWICEQLR